MAKDYGYMIGLPVTMKKAIKLLFERGGVQ